MEYITADTVNRFCNTNEALLKNAPKALVLEFPGLGGNSCLGGVMNYSVYNNVYTRRFAEKDILVAYLFTGPWSWGNKSAIKIADGVVDALLEKHSMSNVPIVVSGGSMGGQSALIYCADSRHKITACAVACPCFDVHGSYTKTPDLTRSVISAVAGYNTSIEEALKRISPLYRINDMQDIPYYILCDSEDELFDAKGMKKYAQKLNYRILSGVRFVLLPGLSHGIFTPEERENFHEFIESECIPTSLYNDSIFKPLKKERIIQ